MKLYLALLLLLVGCGPQFDERIPIEQRIYAIEIASLKNVKGLENCTYTKVDMPSRYLHVIRCPNSSVSTTYPSKNPVTTTTISE